MTYNKDGTPRKKRTNLPSIAPVSLALLKAQLPHNAKVMVSRKWMEALNLTADTVEIQVAAKTKEPDPVSDIALDDASAILEVIKAQEKISIQSVDLSNLLD